MTLDENSLLLETISKLRIRYYLLKMTFFSQFRDAVLTSDGPVEVDVNVPARVRFFLHQFNMVPQHLEDMFCNLLSTYPTTPIYAFISLGAIGTNISRYSSIKRIGALNAQTERCGCFFKLIGPSRVGKGIAMSLITEIGSHIENERRTYYTGNILNRPQIDDAGDQISRSTHIANCAVKYPRVFFLSGANGLQTQAVAAANGGIGIIFVPEIKFGKKRYTDLDGSYGPLLSFYDRYIPEKTYRKAERIPCIKNCRIHLISAGVKSD